MDPQAQLVQILYSVPWDVTQSAQDNIAGLPEVLDDPSQYSQIVQLLSRPVPGLRNVKIYYPVGEADYYHPVEYILQRDIKPIEVLNSISEFYNQPFTQANANALAQLMGQPSYPVEAGDRAGDTLGGHVFLEGLQSYQDGYTLNLGS